MKKILMFVLSILFSTSGFAKKDKITEIENLKHFKPLLKEEKAKEILEMNKDIEGNENYEIKNKKYLNIETETITEEDTEISKEKAKNIKILTANYKNILDLSSSCCVGNIAEKIRIHNMSKNTRKQNIIDLLTFDANTFYIQNTCLLLSDITINHIVKNIDLNKIFKDTRKDCICNNQELLYENIKNFQKLYNTDKNFYKTKFIYKSKDDQGRVIEQDMNETVLNILNTLDNCSK